MYKVKPDLLKKGDKVAIVAPAGAPKEGQLVAIEKSLIKLGLEPIVKDHCYMYRC